MNVIEKIQQEQIRTDLIPFKVGDSVRVHTRIKEGDRERIQVFAGIVINKQGRGLAETLPYAASAMAKASNVCSRFIRRSSRRSRSSAPVTSVARSSTTCASASARPPPKSKKPDRWSDAFAPS
jgi:ribosomal protein L19